MDKQQLDRLLCEISEALRRIACDPLLNWQIVVDGSNIKNHVSLSVTTRRDVPKQQQQA
jgi:hypothetical protein